MICYYGKPLKTYLKLRDQEQIVLPGYQAKFVGWCKPQQQADKLTASQISILFFSGPIAPSDPTEWAYCIHQLMG